MPASGCPSVCVKVFTVHGSVQVMCQIQIGIFWMPKGMLFFASTFYWCTKKCCVVCLRAIQLFDAAFYEIRRFDQKCRSLGFVISSVCADNAP